jgi:hypothetical protein
MAVPDDLATVLWQIKDGNIDSYAEGSTSPIPRLLAAVEAVLNLHVMQETPVLCWDRVCDAHRDKRGVAVQPPPGDCPDCRFRDMWVCRHCNCPNDEWPCPTYRAISAALLGEETDHG